MELGRAILPAAFAGALRVEQVIFKLHQSEVVALLSMEDLTLPTAQDCRERSEFLDHSFGLWLEET